jgi:hypothetical protein
MEKVIENKYYIPTLEEFYSGFEYEHLEFDGNWKQINDFSNEYDYEDNPHYAVSKDISSYHIRVKYLDAKDIESLGFRKIIEDQYYIFALDKHIMMLVDDDLFIRIINEQNNELYYLFQGTIKNKSELKVLLKQIGIL